MAASLEAACCCLQVLAAPGLANSLYMEELVTATVQLAKSQLQYNVLAFHDAQYTRLYRPASAGVLSACQLDLHVLHQDLWSTGLCWYWLLLLGCIPAIT